MSRYLVIPYRPSSQHTQEAAPSVHLLQSQVTSIVKRFLRSYNYAPPHTQRDLDLRAQLAQECRGWSVEIEPRLLEKMIESSCSYAESAYHHTSPKHRYYIALYTACMFYAEELGDENPDAVAQFARRLIKGQRQVNPIFDRLADLLKDAHVYWTDVGADAIITGTVDALTATFIEFATASMPMAPSANRYPYYLRTRAGGGPQFTHFMFMREWRDTADSYLQILP